ncbi:DUF4082 domain-containing protein [Glutamicibacter ardleyensis]|uniref:DUF4082 domain-containing protein n=1 Tax=Glutamicibacter ardleyensis TaxID=225894 RepID=A0ABQ2DFE2_9MICC|nr:DUF4082 domain-containing protein [Glutamicibacter ardleyensis]GGJ55635.1 hypothetical protein GCM10007173_13010 [Glutamicibacter ardleyensis]
MAIYSIFGQAAPTGITLDAGTEPVNLATGFYVVGVAGWRARGARVWVPAGAVVSPTGHKAYLWSGKDMATATLLATADFASFGANKWNEVEFSTTYALTASSYYWVSVYFPDGGFGAKSSVFSGSVQAPGGTPLYGAADSEMVPGNAAFAYGSAGARTVIKANAAGWYGVDVIVDDGTGGASEAYISSVAITDSVNAYRSGGAATVIATGTAKDVLNVTDTDVKTFNLDGDARRTVRRSMWEDRINLSSMQYVDSTYGPDFTSAEPNEFGVEFMVQAPVTIIGSRIYKHPEAAGTIPVTLWSPAGAALATATMNWSADAGGWREILFPSPVAVSPDTRYVMSYFAANGKWCQNVWVYNDMNYYEWPFFVERYLETSTGKSGASRVGGLITSEHVYPTGVLPHNYYVDPIAQWVESEAGPGPNYFDQFPNGGSSFEIPMAVFYPDPPWLEDYASIGVNTACGVPINVPGYRESILASGMDIFASSDDGVATQETVLADPAISARVKGYFLWDEPDMVHNGGTPDQLWTRLSNIRHVDSSRPIVLNLGQWPAQSISYQWWPVGAKVDDVTPMWYGYGEIPDVISCDWYNITKPRLGIWTMPKQVQKMRQLSHGRIPVWAYVETCPIETSNPSPEQMKRAVWAAFIAGATGIVFFDHRFDELWHGRGQDFASSLHDPPMRAAVQEICAQAQSLAGAIKASPLQLVINVASTNTTAGPMGGTYGVPIQQTSRRYGPYTFVFTQSIRPGTTTGTFTVPDAAGKTITVLGESRTLTANGSGTFSDTFSSDYEYHLYRYTT